MLERIHLPAPCRHLCLLFVITVTVLILQLNDTRGKPAKSPPWVAAESTPAHHISPPSQH